MHTLRLNCWVSRLINAGLLRENVDERVGEVDVLDCAITVDEVVSHVVARLADARRAIRPEVRKGVEAAGLILLVPLHELDFVLAEWVIVEEAGVVRASDPLAQEDEQIRFRTLPTKFGSNAATTARHLLFSIQ